MRMEVKGMGFDPIPIDQSEALALAGYHFSKGLPLPTYRGKPLVEVIATTPTPEGDVVLFAARYLGGIVIGVWGPEEDGARQAYFWDVPRTVSGDFLPEVRAALERLGVRFGRCS